MCNALWKDQSPPARRLQGNGAKKSNLGCIVYTCTRIRNMLEQKKTCIKKRKSYCCRVLNMHDQLYMNLIRDMSVYVYYW